MSDDWRLSEGRPEPPAHAAGDAGEQGAGARPESPLRPAFIGAHCLIPYQCPLGTPAGHVRPTSPLAAHSHVTARLGHARLCPQFPAPRDSAAPGAVDVPLDV